MVRRSSRCKSASPPVNKTLESISTMMTIDVFSSSNLFLPNTVGQQVLKFLEQIGVESNRRAGP